jgi:carboxypeptidase Taq
LLNTKIPAYNKLLKKYGDIMVFQTAEGVIHWDMETKMPPKAVEQRGLQLALLSGIQHKMSTNPEIGKLVAEITANPKYPDLSQIEKRNIHLIQKGYREQTRLPEKLVVELAKQEALTVNVWKKAKAAKNFNMFKPELQKLFDLNKQAAELLMDVKGVKTPYEALIDNFEPQMTAATITSTFDQLLKGLKPLLKKIQESPNQPDAAVLCKPVSVEAQRKISQILTQALGYDTSSPNAGGRIDETEHPFTTGYYEDVRITTHYYRNDFANSVFSVLHESGHAIYEQGLNPDWEWQPVGSTCSFGIHESQSRTYENIIGRSKEFWTSLLPKIKQAAPSLASISLDSFIHAINHVKFSKIRIESDEETYNLHIIIRFEIERDLFAGKISVNELPQVWNQKYRDYLGVKIENDSEGVMQDTHWASGLFGYFPSYALGNIYSGQIMGAMAKENPNWLTQLCEGNLQSIKAWLKENIYGKGDLYDPQELILKVTGSRLDSAPFMGYLKEKYGLLYGF